MAIFRGIAGPRSVLKRLVYGDTFPMDTAAASFVTQWFRMNSLFDPDLTGVGGTPTGLTEMAALYNKYHVVASRITVRFQNTCDKNLLVGFECEGPGYHYANSGVQVQQALLEWRTAHAVLSKTSLQVGTVKTLSRAYSMRKMFGTKGEYDDNWAATNANPSSDIQCQLMICNTDGATANNTVEAVVRIVYYVRFFEPHVVPTD